jgi:peptidoglycan L-alanyl-D-glutamate endopeptidase CwlK
MSFHLREIQRNKEVMPRFSKRSINNLSECHIDLQVIFKEVINHFDCSVIEGHRLEAEQNAAFKAGKSKLKFPLSKHNSLPSMAADVVPYPINWNDTDRMRYFSGFVMGIAALLKEQGKITHTVRWGGDWDKDTQTNDQRFIDLPHFELVK